MRTVIAGGSGFIGRALISEFTAAGHEIVILSRSNRPVSGATVAVWDGKSNGPWMNVLEGATTLINLSGKDISTRWTQEHRESFYKSRVDSTMALARAVEQCTAPPAVWLNASAVGFYGDAGDTLLTEDSPAGDGYLANLCREWESSQETCAAAICKARLRIGFVLGKGGGAYPILRKLTSCFLGSALGSGKQWTPWIHIEDLARAFRFCAEQRLEGPVNVVGPNPVTNAELMGELRRALHRPWVPNVPRLILKAASLVALPPPELFLASQRVLPHRLSEHAFEFRYPNLGDALRALAAEAQIRLPRREA